MLQKVAIEFVCEKCKYKTHNKNNFEKHLTTRKHKIQQNTTEKLQKVANIFICECGKTYNHRASLFK